MDGTHYKLFIILARKKPKAVIFRRGPSRWTQLILWHTDSDKFEFGQWFHGRIYERRCDLSPDGEKLIYFASKFTKKTLEDKEYTNAWTAISRPPWLTAISLWPKGDCWHGGGLFKDNNTVWLNHKPDVAIPHPDHMPTGLKIMPNPEAHGEDDPVYYKRMFRDGWDEIQKGVIKFKHHRWITERNEILEKTSNDKSLRQELIGLDFKKAGGPYILKYSVYEKDGEKVIEDADWADFDHQKRLVFSRRGCLFAQPGNEIEPKLIADFNNLRPTKIISPDWASIMP